MDSNMKNPWKRLSKISPQVEDGHCRMNNEILQKLIAHKLNGSQLSVVLYIWRKTWGFNKKEDAIAISQFVRATRLSSRGIQMALKQLKKLRIIFYKQNGPLKNGSPLNIYLFNKHWDTWRGRPLQDSSPLKNKVATGAKTCTRPLNKPAPTINNITKDNKQKTVRPANPDHSKFVKYWCETYEANVHEPYMFAGQKDGKLVKDLISTFGYEKLCKMAEMFIKTVDDNFINECGHTIGIFQLKAQKMVEQLKTKPDADPVFRAKIDDICSKFNDNSEATELLRNRAFVELYVKFGKEAPPHLVKRIKIIEEILK